MNESPDVTRATPDPVGELLDVPGEVPDDGLERNLDGQTWEEFLDLIEWNLNEGNILMENDFWRVEEDAIAEVGVEEVARLRAQTRAFLEEERAERDNKNP